MSEAARLGCYCVQLGHARVHVEGHSPEMALSEARRRLSQEYPRLWKEIHETDEGEFRIDPTL